VRSSTFDSGIESEVGIDFAVNRRIRQALRQKIRCAIDGRLYFLLGNVDVQVQTELQSDDRAAEGARGGHLVEAGYFAKLTLERSGDRRSHHVGTGAGIKRLHLNGRVIDLRKSGDRKLAVGDKAHQQNADHQERGRHRP
jgi:hypothetical protein